MIIEIRVSLTSSNFFPSSWAYYDIDIARLLSLLVASQFEKLSQWTRSKIETNVFFFVVCYFAQWKISFRFENQLHFQTKHLKHMSIETTEKIYFRNERLISMEHWENHQHTISWCTEFSSIFRENFEEIFKAAWFLFVFSWMKFTKATRKHIISNYKRFTKQVVMFTVVLVWLAIH